MHYYFPLQKYKWDKNTKWNDVTAKEFCSQYIRDNYTIGQLCAENVPSVNFKQEINTCIEDIQVYTLCVESTGCRWIIYLYIYIYIYIYIL